MTTMTWTNADGTVVEVQPTEDPFRFRVTMDGKSFNPAEQMWTKDDVAGEADTARAA